jgi:hypothetical protein
LTNQLASQVISEAARLSIPSADLRGDRYQRSAAEEGKFRDGKAVAVSTYANLFNVNPVIQDADVLVLDDAHGGEQNVTSMWTVQIDRRGNRHLYNRISDVLNEALDLDHIGTEEDAVGVDKVELIEINGDRATQEAIAEVLDEIDSDRPGIYFPWTKLRRHLDACVLLVSPREISLRPWTPPTHTHTPFANARQRVFLSATMSGEGDLMRGYGIEKVSRVPARMPQWATRYIFIPGLAVEPETVIHFLSEVWNNIPNRRALMLAPSFAISDNVFKEINGYVQENIRRMEAEDVEDSIDEFRNSENTILTISGRYDGLDLPGDDCRLLIMAESPAAVTVLERYLRESWRLGPIMRRRERTRLIQGMGRCTRHATDYAIILLLGDSLTRSLTTPALVDGMPAEIQKEIAWGKDLLDEYRNDPEQIIEIITGLIEDEQYRAEAKEGIDAVEERMEVEDPRTYEELGRTEVRFGRALWDGDLTAAFQHARTGADESSGDELIGYRALWWYLAGLIAKMKGDLRGAFDCWDTARRCGINTGFLDKRLRELHLDGNDRQGGLNSNDRRQAERIRDFLDQFGRGSRKIEKWLKKAEEKIASTHHHPHYHEGLDYLGVILGAETIRSTEQGAPDVVWCFHDLAIAIEAKTERDDPKAAKLSKRDVQEANGHREWVAQQRPEFAEDDVIALVVSPNLEVHGSAVPHLKSLHGLRTEAVARIFETQRNILRGVQSERPGKSDSETEAIIANRMEKNRTNVAGLRRKFEVLG